MLGLSVSACNTSGQPTVAAATPRGPTVAFESIDGPPESVFQNLVQDLSEEANIRQIAVVSRDSPAQYRIRGYVAAETRGPRSTIAWVLDVYDADRQRALRITGEEPASASGRGTWAVADDQVLRRIAYNGMDRLVAYLAAPNTGPDGAPADQRAGARVASGGDDFSPESAGIFRRVGLASPAPADSAPGALADTATNATLAEAPPEPAPLPRRRPTTAGFTSPDSLAYLAPSR